MNPPFASLPRGRPCTPIVMALSIAAAAIITLSGCATHRIGSPDLASFERDGRVIAITGTRPADEAAACFEEQARFLPFSEFSRDANTRNFTYRLRVAGLWFEQVRVIPTGSSSRAELRVTPGLDAKWMSQFEQHRVAPLRRCLGA